MYQEEPHWKPESGYCFLPVQKQLLIGTLLPELQESEQGLNPEDSLMYSRKNQLYLHKYSLPHREEIQRQ